MKKLPILAFALAIVSSISSIKAEKPSVENNLHIPIMILVLGIPLKTIPVVGKHDLAPYETRKLNLLRDETLVIYPQPIRDSISKRNIDKKGLPWSYSNNPNIEFETPKYEFTKLKISADKESEHIIAANVKATPKSWSKWLTFMGKEEKIKTLYFVKDKAFYKNPRLSAKEIVEKYKKELN